MDLQQSHTLAQSQKQRTLELLTNIGTDISEIGSFLSASSAANPYQIPLPFSLDSAGKSEKLDEEFMVTKLHMSRLKVDIRNLVQVFLPSFSLSPLQTFFLSPTSFSNVMHRNNVYSLIYLNLRRSIDPLIA